MDGPKLAAALRHAKTIGATVVFAKLDRLTRNVDLLRTLVSSGIDLVFCDLPNVPPGAMGRFLLTQMASVAELEAGLTSERTKAALAAAKARGVKLGNPNGARALRGKQVGNKEAVAAIKFRAQEHATNLRSIVDDVRVRGSPASERLPKSLTSVASWRRAEANGNQLRWCGCWLGQACRQANYEDEALTCHGRPRRYCQAAN